MLGGASLAAPLDAEPDIFDALVEVDDPGLGLRQVYRRARWGSSPADAGQP